MRATLVHTVLCTIALSACQQATAQPHAQHRPDATPSNDAGPSTPQPQAAAPELDGNDDESTANSHAVLPAHLRFERVGRAPGGLQRICDLRVFHGALYVALANQPLGSDGAVIARYDPNATTRTAWSLAFDWNRPGQPTRGGGGGQGFLRVRAIDGVLYVPDADPPYNGFGLADRGTEGYVFVSDRQGQFAPARGPTLRPPRSPDADGTHGAAVLPRAYHVLDVLRFRGQIYASTGSVPPRERAWVGPSPGALHLAQPQGRRWTFAVDYPHPWRDGVWRLTFMTRFRGAIYAGIQDYDGREPNDMVVIAPPVGVTTLAQEHVRALRVTPHGGALTLRWFADRGRLFWIAREQTGHVALRVSDDGESFREIPFADPNERPSDIVRYGDSLAVLAESGLYRLDISNTNASLTRIAESPTVTRGRAFRVNDYFCAPPLAVLHDVLYAGSSQGAALYRLTP